MKKIEIIWRELLFSSIEKRQFRFTQKDLASKFGISTSTVAQSLIEPRKMGAIRVTGRFFEVQDAEKLLYHWASNRRLAPDIVYSTYFDAPPLEIEGVIVPGAIFAAYSAVRLRFGEAPADYNKIYIYHSQPEVVRKRFPPNTNKKTKENLIVLKADPFLSSYGQTTTLAQTFVDIWNLSDWYSKDFIKRLREEIDALLS